MKKYYLFIVLLIPFICFCCVGGSSIKPSDYTKESKKIPPTFGNAPTVLVFLVESNLEEVETKTKVIRESKRQINTVIPLYYKGKYEIIESYNEFNKFENMSYRYILHYKVFFPSKNGRTGQFSPNYGDDTYQLFIEDLNTGLHYEPSVKTSDYEGLLKVYAEYLEKERDKSE
ncbi:hypothetical protein ACE193_00860 [Bernardetia sp. OM2101]|uniref:hypothetical protein n=1 Tax=Bernardetia sp. OM2101 TaxID=3344876 RepID=UPI0035CF262B